MRVAIGPSSFAEADAAPLDLLRRNGVEVVANPFGRRLSESEIAVHLKDVDGLVAGLEPLNRAVLSSAPKLRAIARVGIGVDNVDLDAARELGIRVSNTPDQPAAAVAELTLAAMLAISRDIVATNDALHLGRWDKRISPGLFGSTVLLVGHGRIGRNVARMLQPFGVRILVADPIVDPKVIEQGCTLVSLEDGLREADIISLHASGRSTLLGPNEFARLKPGVALLNGARGELVDEAALCAALDEGRVRAAWFDTFWQEPYSGPLTSYRQVILTPHVGTYTLQCRRNMEIAAVENLLADLR